MNDNDIYIHTYISLYVCVYYHLYYHCKSNGKLLFDNQISINPVLLMEIADNNWASFYQNTSKPFRKIIALF